MTKKKGFSSGFYQSKNGTPFHAHGKNMSQETIDAIGAMADAVQANLKKACPDCGNKWLHGLEWEKDRGWYCTCGWAGDEPMKASE